MDTSLLRAVASQLHAAADHVDDPALASATFNWGALVQLLLVLIPQIISLFGTTPTPAPPPTPVPTPHA